MANKTRYIAESLFCFVYAAASAALALHTLDEVVAVAFWAAGIAHGFFGVNALIECLAAAGGATMIEKMKASEKKIQELEASIAQLTDELASHRRTHDNGENRMNLETG